MTESVETDAQQDRDRKRASVRWWSWLVGILIVCIVVLALLSQVFPVAMAVIAGFGASAVGSKRGTELAWSGRALWVSMALQAAVFIGLALLLGAAGLGVEDHPNNAGTGALLGGGLVVGAALVVLVMVLRVRRRAVDREVERFAAAEDARVADRPDDGSDVSAAG
ncbi:hypothetical protein [Curtobacterium sp. VKM Ac-1395]|uniref:hypothetical protein n=1 Tax=Curtobacterium sp. VKM Ac-1395 TaxID=2783815 RepID=UPI00188D6527|nr:hypothetical protein [Curtobacterium sp. VKM Ac-1395]MBF4589288.1 hypothetical protein [Curtobacterium sp. VKM Ac-1395]